MLIRNVINLNTNAEFFNDVQLRWFWDPPKNAKLAKGYIFTQQASEHRKSTVDALNMVRYGLTDPGSENRMLFMATFGQGKTHLALAIANLFGKPLESEEVQHLVQSLRQAYGESPAIKNFTDLKEKYPRHLVVCMQGDEVGFDLSSYFVREVERSLHEELSASGGMLPLWFKTALEMLDTRISQHEAAANKFLASREMDLPRLRQRLEQKDASLYDVTRDLIEHIAGVRPDLGTRLSLNNLVSHVCNEYCGPGKPYAGLVVLFDEFSAFMHAYSKRDTAGTPLQDLLSGIANNREKSVFVAFAQRDPAKVLDSLLPANRDALMVELNRIPQNYRVYLFNNLETVLDAYIGVSGPYLSRALEYERAWPAFLDAEDNALMLFKKRYERELAWSQDEWREHVTFGCFPLHPVTTALLCSVDLAENQNNARGLLQFVLTSIKEIEDQDVSANGVPQWICATRMVDWFEKALCVEEAHWEQYQKALYDGGGDLSDQHQEVLKAMLLHLIAKLPMVNVKYERAVALLAGIDQDDASTALKAMVDRNLIDRDAINNRYIFLSASGGDRDLRTQINRESEQAKLKLETLRDEAMVTVTGFRPTEVPVEWGNAADWQANVALRTSDYFSIEALKSMLPARGGLLIWLIPRDEGDRNDLEAKAQAIIDAACGVTPQPVIVFLPNLPYPTIHEGLRKLQVLSELSPDKRKEYAAFVPNNRNRINEQLKEQMADLRSRTKKWFVHSALTPVLQAQDLRGDAALIRSTVLECFRTAPPSFIKDQKEDNPRVRKASALLGKLLLSNQLTTFQKQIELQPNDGNLKIAENILNSILMFKNQRAWGVVSTSNHVQEPANSKVHAAWNELSSTFPTAGGLSNLSGILERLKKPPFGYDSNTLTLLLCAWIGFYRHDLELTLRGVILPISGLQTLLDAGKPSQFIETLSLNVYAIKRKDRTAARRETEDILTRVRRISGEPLARAEASEAMVKLEAYLADDGNPDPNLRIQVEEARDRVKSDLARTTIYDERARDLRAKISVGKKVSDALGYLEKARDLPTWSGVLPTEPPVEEIVAAADTALDKLVTGECQRLSKLKAITDFGRQQEDLEHCFKALHDKTFLQHRVRDALDELTRAKERLEARQSEDAILRMIDALSAQVPVVELEANLEKLALITTGGEGVRAKHAAKHQEITGKIEALLKFVDNIQGRLEMVANAGALRTLEKEIDGKSAMFADRAESEAKLNAAASRCARLQEFFAALDQLKQTNVQNPQNLTGFFAACVHARQQFGAVLSQTQSKLVDQIEAAKRAELEQKTADAKAWLDGLQRSWQDDNSKPAAFLPTLADAPPFLPEEARMELAALRSSVQKQIDANEEEFIVSKFQGITDKGRREKLVQRLQRLLLAE